MTEARQGYRGYDLIGDVHGCAHTLEVLLEDMGYRKVSGIYEHPRRQAIFLGDILDRGPRIREALHLVRDMVERGSALIVMGNHEYNALCYCTRARAGSGQEFLREHTARNTRLIQETLDQFAHYPHEWHDFQEWFRSIPLFLEMEGFRAVHACWDNDLISAFRQTHGQPVMDDDFLHASMVLDSFPGQVMDRLLRGTDMRLPDGQSIAGRDGFTRRFFRTKFWADSPQNYGDVVFQPDPLPDDIAARALDKKDRQRLLSYDRHQLPLFVGHYWMSGTPKPLRPNIACLDYSAVKYGKLVAYRMDGETVLRPDKFFWVGVDRPERAQEARQID